MNDEPQTLTEFTARDHEAIKEHLDALKLRIDAVRVRLGSFSPLTGITNGPTHSGADDDATIA